MPFRGPLLFVFAAFCSLLLHGLVLVAVDRLARPAQKVPIPASVPVEVVFEAPPEPEGGEAPKDSQKKSAPPGSGLGHTGSNAGAGAGQDHGRETATQEDARRRSSETAAIAAPALEAWPKPGAVGAWAYDTLVLEQLERAKRYPTGARARGARGVAVVGFTLEAAGTLAAAALLRSSGDAELDAESLAIVRRAAPFPRPPHGARRDFAIDVAFDPKH